MWLFRKTAFIRLRQLLITTTVSNVTRTVHAPHGVFAQKNSAGNWQWLLSDGLGSVRGVVRNTDTMAQTDFTKIDAELPSSQYAFSSALFSDGFFALHSAAFAFYFLLHSNPQTPYSF